MKAALLLAGLLALSCISVSAQQPSPRPWKTPHKTKDPQVLEVTQNDYDMNLGYIDQSEMDARLDKDAVLNRWTAAEKEAERAKQPAAYLRASWSRRTIDAASADRFVFLVEAPDGTIILRWTPEPSVAQPFGLMGVTLYTGSEYVPLQSPLPDGARVYAIEAAAGKRFEYVIHP